MILIKNNYVKSLLYRFVYKISVRYGQLVHKINIKWFCYKPDYLQTLPIKILSKLFWPISEYKLKEGQSVKN